MLLTEFGCAVECFASPLNCRHTALSLRWALLRAVLHAARLRAACCALLHRCDAHSSSVCYTCGPTAQVRAVLLGTLGRGRRVRIAWLILRLLPARRQLPGEPRPCSRTRINAAQRGMAARCNSAEYVAAQCNVLHRSAACCRTVQHAASYQASPPVDHLTGSVWRLHGACCTPCGMRCATARSTTGRMHNVRSIRVPVRCTPLAAGKPAV